MKQPRLILFVLIVLFGSHVEAKEDNVDPFIKKEFYKQNLPMEQFQSNPRGYFRSEAAFNLLTGFVGKEAGVSLTSAEFIALMNSDQVRIRDCPTSEKINTGAFEVDQFHWFERDCRSGEQIVQVKLGDRWKDVFSLNCLNAVEDKTPVPPPILTPPTVVEEEGVQYNVAELAVMQGSGVTTFVPANAAVQAACNIETSTSGVFSNVQSSQKSLKKSVRNYDGNQSQGETP